MTSGTTVTHHYQQVLQLQSRGKSLQRFTNQVQEVVRLGHSHRAYVPSFCAIPPPV
jgi:hypothetical protein